MSEIVESNGLSSLECDTVYEKYNFELKTVQKATGKKKKLDYFSQRCYS